MDANFSAVARCERKFRPPKLVQAAACGALRAAQVQILAA